MASLPVGTPGGSIVTHPGSAAIDKVVEFLQRCASHGFEGRRLYVVVNRIQRSGEERVCAAPIEKAGGSLGLDIAILGTIPESATTVAFENIAFQIERLRPRGSIAAVEDVVKTPQKAKTRKPQTARLSKIDERIDDLEGMILVQRDAIQRLRTRSANLKCQAAPLEKHSRRAATSFRSPEPDWRSWLCWRFHRAEDPAGRSASCVGADSQRSRATFQQKSGA